MIRPLAIVLALAAPFPLGAQQPALDAAVRERAFAWLDPAAPPPDSAAADALWREVCLAHGSPQPLIDVLESELAEGRLDADAAWRAHWLLAGLEWRLGELEDAKFDLARALEAEAMPPALARRARLDRARLLDATGETDDAVAAYRALAEEFAGTPTEELLRLRLALMSTDEWSEAGEAEETALARFASEEGRSPELRNRAAIVLGLLGRPADAIELFTLAPRGKDRFRGLARVADWALRAGNLAAAREAAWEAVRIAPNRRERRYALTLLVEAYRAGDGLGELLERLRTALELDEDSRGVWIELLRETGRFEEAIELFRAAGEVGEGGGFSVEQRRELLEMYREAGREDEMVAAFEHWIELEPTRTTWREGLARYRLENGDPAGARAAWGGFLEAAGAAEALEGARALQGLGLDDLARRFAEIAVADEGTRWAALLFLYALERDRGRLEQARAVLERIDTLASPGDAVRLDLAEAFEQLGAQRRAVAVLEGLKQARGGQAGEDTEMRLAWLYSEIGEEEKAAEAWHALWLRVNSIPRRRYVEDRMMTVASRLGTLADLAIRLEEKLEAGTADERESGLLVRLYTKVGDSVSATEVVEEFLKQSGGSRVEALQEKARVFLACHDYYGYERTVRELIEVDPQGEGDYLRQLAMSMLERGKPDEARDVLGRLAELEVDAASSEFEAGVLAIAGLREEAIRAYRRGLAKNSDRIDGYLLMAGLMKQVGRGERAIGMFQYLAESAEQDDLFTIAIDGILNMLVQAPPQPERLAWARRITLERLAARHDKPYLYDLLRDLAEEAQDREGMLAALEASLPSAGTRRSTVLRELSDLARGQSNPFGGGVQEGDRERFLAYGRRLVGLGELVPPQVYLDLGEAFLESGDVAGAARTFRLARDLPDYDGFQRKAAALFEKNGSEGEALRWYERVLVAAPTDVSLLVKVGELHEQLERDGRAEALYDRALELLLSRRLLATEKAEEETESERSIFLSRNVDDFDRFWQRTEIGLLAVIPDRDAAERRIAVEQRRLEADLDEARRRGEGGLAERLEAHPRLAARAAWIRRLAIAFGLVERADAIDRQLLAAFPGDEQLLEALVRERVAYGLLGSANGLARDGVAPPQVRGRVLALLGRSEIFSSASVPCAEALGRVIPLVAEGRLEELRELVRRTETGSLEKDELGQLSVLYSAARLTGDPGLMLEVARDWLRLAVVRGQEPYQVQFLVESLFATLPAGLHRDFAQYAVGVILGDEQRRGRFLTLLPELQKRVQEPLIESEQLFELFESAPGNGYELAPVLALLPEAERSGALRTMWSKVAATQRASFLCTLVAEFPGPLGEELANFVRDAFPGSIAEADDFFQYMIQSLAEVDHDRDLVIAIAEALADSGGEFPSAGALRLRMLARSGQAEEVAAEAAKEWAALAAAKGEQWQLQEARNWLAEDFLPEHLEAFLAADREREGEKRTAGGVLRRAMLVRDEGEDPERAIAMIEAGLARFPDSIELLEAKAEADGSDWSVRLAALERLAELEPDEPERHRALWRELESRRLFARALAERVAWVEAGGEEQSEAGPPGFRLPPGAILVVNGVVYRGGEGPGRRGLPRRIEDVARFVEEDRSEQARAALRRLWRNFTRGEGTAAHFAGFFVGGWTRVTRLAWPQEPGTETDAAQNPEAEAERRRLARDGLDAYREPEQREPEEQRSAFDVLAEHPFGIDEMRRWLRTLDGRQLDSSRPLVRGLLLARERAEGSDAVLADLLERVRAERAGKVDFLMLLALLDEHPELADASVRETLHGALATVSPRDASQVMRLARIAARSGVTDEAVRLYRWCATRTSSGPRYVVYGGGEAGETSVNAHELVREAREVLQGEDRVAVVEAVLGFAAPADDPWERENHEVFVLDTWQEMLGSAEALARGRAICERALDLSTGLRRRVALRAAGLFARAGELERALRGLEIGLAALDPAEVASTGEYWWAPDPEQPGGLDSDDLARLFPADPAEFAAPAQWYAAAGSALLDWLSEDRVRSEAAVHGAALAAARLVELGAADAARELAERLVEREDLGPAERLWVADAARRVGAVERANAIERELFERRELVPARVPDVLRRVLEQEGAERAYELGSQVAAFVRPEGLLELLVQAARLAGDEQAAERWQAARAEDEAAREDLRRLAKEAQAARERARASG